MTVSLLLKDLAPLFRNLPTPLMYGQIIRLQKKFIRMDSN